MNRFAYPARRAKARAWATWIQDIVMPAMGCDFGCLVDWQIVCEFFARRSAREWRAFAEIAELRAPSPETVKWIVAELADAGMRATAKTIPAPPPGAVLH